MSRIAYVAKVYPRFSETFVVNEILAHEEAGAELEIVSLRPPGDGRLHESVGRVRAPVTYLASSSPRAEALLRDLHLAAREWPDVWQVVASMPEAGARDVEQALKLARIVRERGIEHLHAHFANAATVVARLAARLVGVTYSLTAHAKDIFHEDVDRALLARQLRDASLAVTVSEFNLAHLRELCPEANLRRVYNGMHLERFPYASPIARERRIVAVGRLIEKKGFGDLVDACALLRDRGVALRCDIAGDGELRDELSAQIAARELGDVVRLTGPLVQDDVRALVQRASVLAAPCVVGADGNRDGLPTVLLEAMALGTPCVSTAVTGIPEAVRHDETGIIVGQHDPAGLAAALQLLLDDGARRARLAAAARALVEERFDERANAARIRQLWAAGCAERPMSAAAAGRSAAA